MIPLLAFGIFLAAVALLCDRAYVSALSTKPLPWRRSTPWIVLAVPVLVWLFWFGAIWSIADRVRGVEYPLPWPGDAAHRFRHTDSTPATENNAVYVRVTPNRAYYAETIDDDSPLFWTVLWHPIGTGSIEWREWTLPFAERRENRRAGSSP